MTRALSDGCRSSRRAQITLLACLASLGCSSKDNPAPSATPEAGDDSVILGDDAASGEGVPGSDEGGSTCLGEIREAEAIGLDMYVMLDTSGSMLDLLPAEGRLAPVAPTKWEAVLGSLEAFVQAPDTEDIGIGIQYFPQVRPDVPFACSTNAQCGGAGGPCSNSICVEGSAFDVPNDGVPALQFLRFPADGERRCVSDADCAGPTEVCRNVLGACVIPPGTDPEFPNGASLDFDADPGRAIVPLCGTNADCQGLPGTACDPLGFCPNQPLNCTASLGCPAAAGTCTPIPFGCVNQTLCEFDSYSAPAVAIGTGEAHSAELVASLRARVPDGLTPTGPALGGALLHAQTWAEQNPDRQVVTVLATDGLPTECTPLDFPGLSALASDALNGDRRVRTFVIGVFGRADLGTDGEANLNALARAGGTDNAIIINTGGNVAAEFLEALNRIRDSAVSCVFQLDQSAALDFDRVNLLVSDAAGQSSELESVGDSSACGGDQGWYYVRDAAGVPVSINVCPSTCELFTEGGVRAELQIGCETRIR